MVRRFAVIGALVLALAGICRVALAGKSFTDPVGDVKGGAGPDVTSITLSNTPSTITFHLRFASAPPLRVSTPGKWVDMLLIGIDVPPLGALPVAPGGEWAGADFALGTHGPSKTGLLVRLGKKPSAPTTRFKIVTRGRTLSFSIPRHTIGSPRWFVFSVAAAREGDSRANGGGLDIAPGRGVFRYRLS